MRFLVQADKFKIGDEIGGRKIKSFGKTFQKKQADNSEFRGQLWQECSCGMEPVYLPSEKCENCINRYYGIEKTMCYAYVEGE